MMIKYKRIKKQADLVERIGSDLFSDPVVRSSWLRLLISHPNPFDYMILLHLYPRYMDNDGIRRTGIDISAKKYWELMKKSDGTINLIRYPVEVRKIIYDVFYNYVRLPLNVSPLELLYGEFMDSSPVQNLEMPYADIEVIITIT